MPHKPGRYWQDVSERLVYSLDVDLYESLRQRVILEFGLREMEPPQIDSLGDFAWQRVETDGDVVSLNWDIWSGFMVVSESLGADDLVRQIGAFLDSADLDAQRG